MNKNKKTLRILNNKDMFMGLNMNELGGLSTVGCFSCLYLIDFIPFYVTAITFCSATIGLMTLRKKYRRGIIRDYLKFLTKRDFYVPRNYKD